MSGADLDLALLLVATATGEAAESSQRRNEAIRAASSAGATIRAIAKASGLSSARVHQILHGR